MSPQAVRNLGSPALSLGRCGWAGGGGPSICREGCRREDNLAIGAQRPRIHLAPHPWKQRYTLKGRAVLASSCVAPRFQKRHQITRVFAHEDPLYFKSGLRLSAGQDVLLATSRLAHQSLRLAPTLPILPHEPLRCRFTSGQSWGPACCVGSSRSDKVGARSALNFETEPRPRLEGMACVQGILLLPGAMAGKGTDLAGTMADRPSWGSQCDRARKRLRRMLSFPGDSCCHWRGIRVANNAVWKWVSGTSLGSRGAWWWRALTRYSRLASGSRGSQVEPSVWPSLQSSPLMSYINVDLMPGAAVCAEPMSYVGFMLCARFNVGPARKWRWTLV